MLIRRSSRGGIFQQPAREKTTDEFTYNLTNAGKQIQNEYPETEIVKKEKKA
jgi:hypothetical protein